MSLYRTEIQIPADRTIVLHLPAHLPTGRAIVTVRVEEAEAAPAPGPLAEADHQDIVWWEEFDEADEPDPASPAGEP